MGDGLTPTELTVLCLLFVGFHALALPYFIWAVRHRQFACDLEASLALDEKEEALSPSPASTPLSFRAILLLSLLVVLFVPTILMSLFTVYEATHLSATPTSAKTAPLKCPFGG